VPIKLIDAVRLAAPLAAAAAAVSLALLYIAPGVDLDAMSRGIAGPGTWPKVMLFCAAACSVAVFLRNLFSFRAERSGNGKSGVEKSAGTAAYDDAKLLPGIALLLAYGIAIPEIGMAWSTLLFIAAWLVLSGFRRPRSVALVSVLGTAGILYLFVKLCLMPLDRGKGVFEQATILAYRLLGIY
jgi:putative tricarboxylic transport membrane protein